jgi:hypothetical protein
MRRALAFSCVLALALALFAVPASAAVIPGLVALEPDDGQFAGAWLDTSLLEVGKSYKLEFNVTTNADANGGFRVRYSQEKGNGPYNDAGSPAAHSTEAATAVGLVASQVPARFLENTVPPGTTGTLVVNFTLGAAIPDLSPLTMAYIGLFGLSGDGNYICNYAAVYEAGELIGYLDQAGNTAPQGGPTQPGPVPTGDGAMLVFALCGLVLFGAGFVLSKKAKA